MSDLNTINAKLDKVIEKISKSKKFASVRILEEVKVDLQNYDVGAAISSPIRKSPIHPAVKTPSGIETYVPQDGEVDDLVHYIGQGKNVLLTGGTGCGKTCLVQYVLTMLGKTWKTIQGNEGMRAQDIIGYRDLRGGDTSYTYGVLPSQMKTKDGCIYWDEPNASPQGIQFVCFSAMDDRHEVTLPENGGEVVKAEAGFCVIGAMNEGQGYRGTSQLSDAMRDRFHHVIPLKYLPEAREAKLLVDRTGIDLDIAKKFAKAAKQLRDSMERGDIKTPVSTRALIAACDAIVGGRPIGRAIETAIINKVSGLRLPERKTIADVMEAHFGKLTGGQK